MYINIQCISKVAWKVQTATKNFSHTFYNPRQRSIKYPDFMKIELIFMRLLEGKSIPINYKKNPFQCGFTVISKNSFFRNFIPLQFCIKFSFRRQQQNLIEYSVVSIKRTGSLNYFEVFFHPVRSYTLGFRAVFQFKPYISTT